MKAEIAVTLPQTKECQEPPEWEETDANPH